tara:strand:- start:163 stop:405 length:243 start_codon:yes stop_codon:yes gene_type:complete
MATDSLKEYKVGDLVKWYERTADGFMVKDAGQGIILERREYTYTLGTRGAPYITYSIFRTKYQDTMIFETIEIEELLKEN